MNARRGRFGGRGGAISIRRAFLLIAAAGIFAGSAAARAGAKGSVAPAAAAPAETRLETLAWGSVERMHRFDGVYLASQPGKEDLALAKDAGVKTVIDLRKPGELDWNERAEVEKLGMEYDNFGFKEPEELTDAVLDGARKILDDPAKKPILLHCSSANRVGAIWLAHRALDDHLPLEEAVREAEEVGLKSAAFRDRARDYVERRRRAHSDGR
jgi:uncharacterized protein (TIGR01244 family)